MSGTVKLQPDEIRRRVTSSLAEILAAAEGEWPGTILITGGDTLAACLSRLGCRELEPLTELFPGVVLSRIRLEGRPRLVVSKSGGFGGEALLADLRALIEKRAAL